MAEAGRILGSIKTNIHEKILWEEETSFNLIHGFELERETERQAD